MGVGRIERKGGSEIESEAVRKRERRERGGAGARGERKRERETIEGAHVLIASEGVIARAQVTGPLKRPVQTLERGLRFWVRVQVEGPQQGLVRPLKHF